MGVLIEGLDDYVDAELARIRADLRAAIAESDYTYEQVATFAGIGASTLRAVLAGRHASGGGLDTLIRIGYIVGVRVDLSTGDGRSFQVVPLAQSFTGSRTSSSRRNVGREDAAAARGHSDSDVGSKKKAARSPSGQRKRSPRRKGSTGWYLHLVTDLPERDTSGDGSALIDTLAA